MPEIVMGETVYYRGREYIVCKFREEETGEGRFLTMECLEPIYAQRNKMDQEARRAQVEQALALMPKVHRVVDEAMKDTGI